MMDAGDHLQGELVRLAQCDEALQRLGPIVMARLEAFDRLVPVLLGALESIDGHKLIPETFLEASLLIKWGK